MKINDGGPAFPLRDGELLEGPGSGMTLRDYFAAQAIGGILYLRKAYWEAGDLECGKTGVRCAELAYEVADAMLQEREKKQESKP